MKDLRKNTELPLHEEVMLLALRDQKGTIDSKAQFYPQIVAGAIISELLLSEYIEISNDKKQLVEVIKDTLTGNEILDEALNKISEKRKPQSLKYWVTFLPGIRNLKNKIAQSLCEKGILDEVEVKILWVFSSLRFPELDSSYEDKLIARLDNAIFGEASEIDVKTATLIALLKKSPILSIPFDSKKLKARKDRIEDIAGGSLVSEVAAEVIQTIQSVIFITVVMPAVMVAVT